MLEKVYFELEDKVELVGLLHKPKVETKEVVISFGKSFTSNEVFDKKVSAKVLSKYTKEKVLELKNRS